MRKMDLPAGFWTAGLLFAMVMVLTGCDWKAYFKLPARSVYVTADALHLRKAPTTRAPVLGQLSRGDELKVLEKKGKWIRVRTEEKETGWVHGDYVGNAAAVRAAMREDLEAQRRQRRPQAPAAARAPTTGQTGGASRLNLSIQTLLAGLPESFDVQPVGPAGEEQRYMGSDDSGQVVEFWGDLENVTRASLMVPVVGVPDTLLARHAELVAAFVRNAVPQWKRKGTWVAGKLRDLTRLDTGVGGFDADGRSVRFRFIKPLGTVRIVIEPEAGQGAE